MAEPCRSQGFALFGKIKCECVALNYSFFIIHSSLFSALSALNKNIAPPYGGAIFLFRIIVCLLGLVGLFYIDRAGGFFILF